MSLSDENKPLLWLVALGFFMQALDATILNTALPSIARNLGESPLRMESVIISYTLTVALLMPASGWLADRFGIRRVFFCSIIIFTLGSLLCADAHKLWHLVVARVIQGLGGAMLMPVGRLAVLREYPGPKLVAAMSFVTMPGLLGPLLGPMLGGWLVQIATWHWIFLINLPIGLVGAWAVLRFMSVGKGDAAISFDLPGYLLLAVGMVLLSLGLQGFGELGFARANATLMLIAGLASIVSYWLHAAGKKDPLFDLKLFGCRSFAVGLLGNMFARLGSGAMPFLLPLALQLGLGYAPLAAGLTMMPIALAAIAIKPFIEKVLHRFGYRQVLTINTFLVGCMIASFALLSRDTPVWLLAIHLGVFGAFNSVQFTSMNTLTLKDLKGRDASAGNSLLSMVMQLSVSLGIASAAALLSAFAKHFGSSEALWVFRGTFLCVGAMGALATVIFAQYSDEPTVEA